VTAQCLAVRMGDQALDSSHATAIHETRVAIRRLRSALRVFAELLEPLPTTALDVELQWYASVLGQVRDCQVLRTRLDALVTEVSGELPPGSVDPVKEQIETELRREYAERWLRLEIERRGERYRTLMSELDDWVEELPSLTTPDRDRRATRRLVRQAEREVPRKLRRATKHDDPELLHAARKAAKRARYAEEAAAPVLGRRTSARAARRYRKLQELLGEHQDSLLSAEFLRRLASQSDAVLGEAGLAIGVLYEREMRNAHRSQRQAHRVAKRQ
jgi:CHAD domain-containing protein